MSKLLDSSDKGFGFYHSEGISFFSKFPVLDTGYIRLSRNFNDLEDDLQRICMRVLLDTPRGTVYLFIASLSLVSQESRKRHAVEVTTLLKYKCFRYGII